MIPTIPGIFMGYRHPSGEVHITENNEWVVCPGKNYVSEMEKKKLTGHNLLVGQDNKSANCAFGTVKDIFDGKLSDHDGPYDNVTMNYC